MTNSTDIERANFHHLVLEVAWFGLALAATSRFLAVFAIRLGATPAELGWITALPYIVLLGSTALSTRWRSKFPDSIRAIFWPSLGFRFVFLFPALTPLFPTHLQPAWLILSAALAALPQGISSTIFVSVLKEAIPEDRLTPLISRRTVGMNLALGLAALAFGFWLELAPFPMNYQVMFLAAFALALISQIQLMRVRVKPMPIVQRREGETSAPPLQSTAFQKTLFIGVIIHIGFFAILPVTPLYLVQSLGAAEGFMALFGIAEIGSAATIALFTSRIAKKIGHRKMVGFSMVGTATAALIMALAHNLPITLIAGAISGACWTAATVGLFGTFVESTHDVPNTDMTRYATIYHQLIFIAAFIGPMIGSNLANSGINLMLVMLVGVALRLLASGAVLHIDHLWSWLVHPSQRIRRAYRRS
jgi:MFS family permease